MDTATEVKPEPENVMAVIEQAKVEESPLAHRPTGENAIAIKAKTLREFLKQLAALQDEFILEFEDWGVHAKIVDSAHVAMLDISMDKSAFLLYAVKGNPHIYIDIDDMLRWSKQAKEDDDIHMRFEPETYKNKNGDEYTELRMRIAYRYFRYSKRVDFADKQGIGEPKAPHLNLPVTFTIPRMFVVESLKAVGDLSDHITIKTSEDGVDFCCNREDNGETLDCDIGKHFLDEFKEIPPSHEKEIDHRTKDFKYKSMFPCDYLENIMKAIKSEMVTLNVGNDYPIEIRSVWAGGRGKSMYLLAPRVESE